MTSKRRCQYRHAKIRFIQRAGMLPERADFEDMVKQIQTGKAKFVDRQSKRVTRWRVDYAGKDRLVVYDKNTKQIVTILEDDWVK